MTAGLPLGALLLLLPVVGSPLDHVQSLGRGSATFNGEELCALDSIVLVVETQARVAVVQLTPNLECAHIGFYALIPYHAAAGTAYVLEGDWESGFRGLGLGGSILIGPYGDGNAIAIRGCNGCDVASVGELVWTGIVADMRIL